MKREVMADYKAIRYDKNYPEPLDPEIIPLCDALNAKGFITVSSCEGHGSYWPHVWFEHSSDERIERLARFVKSFEQEQKKYNPYFTMWQKEILIDGYAWCVEVHCNDIYANTPRKEALKMEVKAINKVSERIMEFNG